MADKPIVRVGVIGAGANTRDKHIPGLAAIEGVQIVGVCNRSEESSRKVAEQFGIPKTYRFWPEVIADAAVDAIVIGTWPYLHCPATLAALAAGKHVLCEARMAMNVDEARAMRDAARSRPELVAQVVPAPFTLRVDRTVQRLIAEEFLGQLLVVELRAGGSFLNPDGPLTWRQQTEFSGNNIMGLGIWYESLMRWVGVATRVCAMGKVFVPMRKDQRAQMHAVSIPEHLDVIAEMACGAQLHMQLSAATGLIGGPEIYLCGATGTLKYADNKLYGRRKGDQQLTKIEIPAAEVGKWRVEEEFINAIRGVETVTHTRFEDGVKYMEFTDAVAKSIACGGQPVIVARS